MIRDLSGLQFGRLAVIEFSHIENQRSHWRCRCACGGIKILAGARLTRGNDKSCGCLRSEMSSSRAKRIMKGNTHHLIHGMHDTSIHHSFMNMHNRCQNNAWYIERNITIEESRWQNKSKDCVNFIHAMSKSWQAARKQFPNELIDLHRIDNKKGYSKANCMWTSRSIHAQLRTKERRQ